MPVKILFHLGKILKLVTIVHMVAQRLIAEKDLTPSKEEWMKIIDAVLPLIDTVIQIPDFDPKMVIAALESVKQELLT